MRVLTRGALLLAICVAAPPAKSDEIQLKDGKTFYGVIVAYDNNMFKVKTDFGYILVEKSKIAAILPNGSEAAKNDAKGNAKPGADAPGTPARKQGEAERSQPSTQPVKADAVQPSAEPAVMSAIETPAPRISNAAVRPAIPALRRQTP
jgi:small nuclear ribonucleoprotein (snRNP)-like protein